jgi:3-hydroxypropanoate dehydrogenase
MLRNAMKLALLAPSAYNCCPMRVVFVMNENTSAKDKLLSCLDPEGLRQTQEAPVTAIVCTDLHYTHNLPKLMPYVPNAQQMFEQYDDLNEMIRIRNSNLQAGYLILALRSLGLGVGPLSNFDNEKCDQLFLENSTWRSNFLINLGYAKDDQYPPRAYRLEFDVAAKLL